MSDSHFSKLLILNTRKDSLRSWGKRRKGKVQNRFKIFTKNTNKQNTTRKEGGRREMSTMLVSLDNVCVVVGVGEIFNGKLEGQKK